MPSTAFMPLRPLTALLLGLLLASTAGAVPITTLGVAYTQNFDTLADSGQSSSLPSGWALNETGTSTNVDGQYNAGTGSNNAGDVYSFGAAGSTERAFGTLLSGSLTPIIGVQFGNSTGSTITSLLVAYVGEQWRAGVANRGAADRLDFQISTDATSLSSGTWADVDALDFSSPNVNAGLGALDGNSAANRAARSGTIAGLTLLDGSSFWLRWTDFNIASSDDGLAVDDFSITARGATTTPPGTAPEPGSVALAGLALAGLALTRRRRR